MADNETRPTGASVSALISAIEEPQKRADGHKVAAMMKMADGSHPKLWGESIVGYGSYRHRYHSGREGEFMITGFAPRKQALSVDIMPGFSRYDALMSRLGNDTTGKSCLYLRRLADVDEAVLQQLITQSVADMRAKYETR